MKRTALNTLGAAWVASVVALIGCDNDCGEGTEEVDGVCRAISPASENPQVVCGQGTELEGAVCVPVNRACGDDTMLVDGRCTAMRICGVDTAEDADGVCQPADTVCGSNTTFNTESGVCENTSGVECGFGTTPSMDGAECIPDLSVVCAAGTVRDTDGCVVSARVQLIHMSADPDATTVDVWVADSDGMNASLLIDDFAFRTATPFIDLLPGTYDVAVAPSDSTSFAEQVFLADDVTLTGGRVAQVVARGVITPSAFDTRNGVEAIAFTLDVIADASENDSSVGDGRFEARMLHASADAPTVDVEELGLTNVHYGENSGPEYIELPGGLVSTFDVDGANDGARVASYQTSVAGSLPAPFGLPADVVTLVVANGFIRPMNNRMGAAFALHAVFGDGTVAALDLAARLQLFHNAAGVPEVDIYGLAPGDSADESTLIATLDFREATAFATVVSNTHIDVVVARAGEEDPTVNAAIVLPLASLGAGTTNRVIAVGDTAATEGAADAPALVVISNSTEAPMDPTQVAVQVFQGVSDAPTIDFFTELVSRGTPEGSGLLEEATYTSASNPAPVAPNDYVVSVADDEEVLARSSLLAEAAAGASFLIAASGFLAPEGAAPELALVSVDNAGNVVELPGTARLQLIHDAPDPAAATVDVLVGGTAIVFDFAFRQATSFWWVPTEIDLALARPNSTVDVLGGAVDDLGLEAGTFYVGVAQGVLDENEFSPVDAGDVSFRVNLLTGVDTVSTTGHVGFSVVHGSPDVGVVDVSINDGAVRVESARYGETVGNAGEAPSTSAIAIDIEDSATPTVFARFELPSASAGMLDGRTVTALASGFVTPGDEPMGAPSFNVVLVAPDGTVVELDPIDE